MLDIGWMELVVLGIVALLVVGPKELPALLRTIGRMIAMAKRQANEFRAQFDEAIRDTEFEDVRRQMDDIRHGRFTDLDETTKTQAADTGKKPDPAKERDVDFEDQRPIEPAPEFRDETPADSFTMADGTVVTRHEPAPAPVADAPVSDAPVPDTPPDAPPAGSGAGTRTATGDAPAAEPDSPPPPTRNAEAVR